MPKNIKACIKVVKVVVYSLSNVNQNICTIILVDNSQNKETHK